ncbi:phosphoenolpyruvate carboxylase [Formicincola oecophyllae]|uniref:Phosphoenolpyruvate carboxylase n=1 Tax=Formicincola oecophyllae TaxID=2558361 RepID=A0A4Y6U948_9PROT|nr:phosphoenolpyruvate carboxylase [Formicincola oecophyllae]QDH12976.1 phosphoenolpyruvate carboxylase [Formicincola oecophyllae]
MTDIPSAPLRSAGDYASVLNADYRAAPDAFDDIIIELREKSTVPGGMDKLEAMVRALRDQNFEERASALRRYVGLGDGTDQQPEHRLAEAAKAIVAAAPNPAALATPLIAGVFTAHPTFALSDQVYDLLARKAAHPETEVPHLPTHRRAHPPTLPEELALALAAISRGRDALDALASHIITEARKRWPDAELAPAPVLMASWVGFDTDGRNDIGWWDTIRIRLDMKIAQLRRLLRNLGALSGMEGAPLTLRVATALAATEVQRAACPPNNGGRKPEPEVVARFARRLIELREDALLDASSLDPLFKSARADLLARGDTEGALALEVQRAGFFAHGLGLAQIHTRLNAAQIYNVVRTRLGLTDDPALQAQRRVLIARIDEAMDKQEHLPVDFGALLIEPSAAARLMMTMAQILKHIDSGAPIRFLIAETESGYTLLAALWLARCFGIKPRQLDISPLFETEYALENGETILEEAFRSKHWRDYLRANGRLSLQFGYSDSGRYIGQLAAGTLIERLRLRALALLKEHGLEDVTLLMFDTHGESIGRGAHPYSMRQRLNYFSPAHTRQALAKARMPARVETAFQGGDGYTLFGAPELAASTIATMAEFAAESLKGLESGHAPHQPDPLYERPDFGVDFFSTIAIKMAELVDDPGYTALLSAFGPALIDKTGSRPAARQTDSATVTRITHPSQIRAIPNNAILMQLGWWATLLHGLGGAAQRHPEIFEKLRRESPRFRQMMDFARQACRHSDIEVLRGTLRRLDPGNWLDRAGRAKEGERQRAFLAIAHTLEGLQFWKSLPPMFRSLQRENIALKDIWPEAEGMAGEEKLLHAIRFALLERIWLLSTRIPYFGPRGTLTRDAISTLIMCLDVPRALTLLDDLFPIEAPSIADLDFGEEGGSAAAQGFAREHEQLFRPLRRCFELLREVGIAIQHANHAFG